MGSFEWVFRRTIYCPDGSLSGTLRKNFLRFRPHAGDEICNVGIFSSESQAKDPNFSITIEFVTWVGDRTGDRDGYFLVDLEDHHHDGPTSTATIGYSTNWRWSPLVEQP